MVRGLPRPPNPALLWSQPQACQHEEKIIQTRFLQLNGQPQGSEGIAPFISIFASWLVIYAHLGFSIGTLPLPGADGLHVRTAYGHEFSF